MRTLTVAEARRYQAYCERRLADPALHPVDRVVVRERLAACAERLAGSCRICGRTLTDPDSLAAGIGPECAKALAP
jgi:hypothetical protein